MSEEDTGESKDEDDAERRSREDATLSDPRFRTEGDATDGETGDREERSTTDRRAASTDPDDADPVELGVALIERLEDEELSMADLMDRVETVSTHPRVVSDIIEAAEERGVIERNGATVRPQGGGYVRFGADVVTKEGEFSCRRCGTGLSEGYFIKLDAGEIGPFGSSCIRKVTGRE